MYSIFEIYNFLKYVKNLKQSTERFWDTFLACSL